LADSICCGSPDYNIVSVGYLWDSPTELTVGSLVAWIAARKETEFLKPIDKAIPGMVSESPGRNASEPKGGLDAK
jgi:hypothetical protein